jgi:thiol-disulfide isomerase/thioredoxin
MEKLAISLILLSSLFFASGCADKAQENFTNHSNIQNKSVVVEATKLKQINMSLQKGPVFLEIGAPRCSDCQTMKSILSQIGADYGDKITVISINMSKSPKLAEYFEVRVVPVSFVIIGINNDNYTYMRGDGNVSTNVSTAKIVGLRDKEVFEKVLDTALQQK